jgi:argininosuccinate lyase
MLERDRQRMRFVEDQCSSLPLGSGALAGVNFETDRKMVAEELGFASVTPNSLDAVSSRDFVLDYLAAAATCATHLSRLGSELVIWSSTEFGFVELPDGWTSGSSLMPQKKNPDAAELLRAKAPRIVGDLSSLHGVIHALPLAYNKDLQEDKEYLFDAADSLALALVAAEGMVSGAVFNSQRMAEASSDEMIAATDIADMLVRRGMAFREAHAVVGALVREAAESGRTLSELSDEEMLAQSELLDDEVREVLRRESWTESKVSEGGTASARVAEQLEAAERLLP